MMSGPSALEPERRRQVPWPAIVSVAAVLCGLLLAMRCLQAHLPFFGLYHDDALYVVAARSLAEGSGYRIISLPGEPFQTKYPILYPLLLSLFWRANPKFPENLWPVECFNVLIGVAFAVASCLYLVRTRRVTGIVGSIIFAATVLNIKFLSFLPMTMSDFLCALFSVLSLWSAEAAAAALNPGALPLASGLAGGLAFLARTSAAVVAPCAALSLFLAGRLRQGVLAFLSASLLVVPYLAWSQSYQSVADGTLTFYTSHTGWMAAAYRDLGAWSILASKAGDAFSSVHQTLWPLAGAIPYTKLSPWQFFLVYRVLPACLWALIALGLCHDMRRRARRALPLYMLFYAATTLTWPGWLEWRLVLVVMPFLYYFAYSGARALASGLERRLPRAGARAGHRLRVWATFAAAVYLVAGSLWSSCLRAGLYPRRLPQRADLTVSDEFADAGATYRWIRDNTGQASKLIAINDPLLFLHTDRQAYPPSPYEGWRVQRGELVTPESLLEAIVASGADYLVLDPSYGAAYATYGQYAASLLALSLEYPQLFRPVFVSPKAFMTVFAVDGDTVRLIKKNNPGR